MCLFIFMKCYFRHLICHSLVNVQRSVSVDVCCHHLTPPTPLPSSQHSFSSTSLAPSFSLSSSTLPSLNPAPSLPVPAPHAGGNFRASCLDPSIQLEMPCIAAEHLPWMCSTECSNAPPGHVKGVLEEREGAAPRGGGDRRMLAPTYAL